MRVCRRRYLKYADVTRPAASAPSLPSSFATDARINIDYHIDVERHYYSVPYQLVGHRLDVRR